MHHEINELFKVKKKMANANYNLNIMCMCMCIVYMGGINKNWERFCIPVKWYTKCLLGKYFDVYKQLLTIA